ncbi:unnamed protein product [Owenia fusiformis]|uniref:Uncharacterized protein n=1 Tax=Owenia fusiformis TaxID=6347 RepID=A0A8J1XGG0_OWEFU|nr:unnamed protein product [Owenia fusiformis]
MDPVFKASILTSTLEGFKMLTLTMAKRLRMFEILGKYVSPKTSKEIAESAGYRENYVTQLLDTMVTFKYINYDVQDKTYFLPIEHREVLNQESWPLKWLEIVPLFSAAQPELEKIFKVDGPTALPEAMNDAMQPWLNEHWGFDEPGEDYVKQLVDSMPELKNKLEAGIQVLDVGCGWGGLGGAFAKLYPKSTLYGIDLEGIDIAKKNNADIKNAIFSVADCTKLDPSWSDKFDYVYIRNVLHFVPPKSLDSSIQEIYRVLKPGGTFSLIQFNHKEIGPNKGDIFVCCGGAIGMYAYHGSEDACLGGTEETSKEGSKEEEYKMEDLSSDMPDMARSGKCPLVHEDRVLKAADFKNLQFIPIAFDQEHIHMTFSKL